MNKLPKELVLHIDKFLNPRDLIEFGLSCKTHWSLTQESVVWKPWIYQKLHDIMHELPLQWSLKEFYGLLLHRFGDLLGYWQADYRNLLDD